MSNVVMRRAFGLSILGLAMLLTAGCNSATDDPGQSEAIVAMADADPSVACADVDGVEKDLNGDGTNEIVFESVVQELTLESRVRSGGNVDFSDVIFDNVEIRYDLTVGQPPPRRSEGIAVTVPAGGTGAISLTTIFGDDIINYWWELNPSNPGAGTAVRGTIRVKFTGRDAGGEPVTATGAIPIEAAGACSGS